MNRLTNKKTLKEILSAYDRQIRKDIGFSFKLGICWSYTNFKFYLVKYFQDLVDSPCYSIGLLDISYYFRLFKGSRSGGGRIFTSCFKRIKMKRFLLDALTAGLLSLIASNAESVWLRPIHVRVWFG